MRRMSGPILTKILLSLVSTFAGMLWLTPSLAQSQELIEPTIHWAYASFFGTGWYKINDERRAFVLRTTPRWVAGDAGFDQNGRREIAYTLRAPLTIGLDKLDFEDIPEIIDVGNVTSLSANLGVDADIPLTRRLSIRPGVQLGYGTVLGQHEDAVTYKAELKSRYTLGSGKLGWALLADAGFAGYEPGRGDADNFAFVRLGAEFEYPVNWFSTRDREALLYWHVSFTDFLDEIEVEAGVDAFDSVANTWQIGAAFGKRNESIQIWFLKFERLGIGYNFSTSGELRGIKLLFNSLYEL